MCGIAGFWAEGTSQSREVVIRMASAIAHRGPDDEGVWLDDSAGIALAHRRLSVIDLSPAGHQPMVSSCGKFVLVYNGEIYNHKELREEMYREGHTPDWRGHSDTETILVALSVWGIQRTLERLNGMYSFALWDIKERTLFLARDRMGEKPLYYGQIGDTFLFGSELKALAEHPQWRGHLNRDALALYLRHSYVPAPWCIFRGIKKLPPAHFVAIRHQGRDISGPICYWDLAGVARQGVSEADPETLVEELEYLLRDAVERRTIADVPHGAFLSGGYDSTLVTALMQSQSEKPVATFSVGFHEEDFNEANYAKLVADHLGTDHTELYIRPEEAISVIPHLPQIYDEPFSDSSQIPTYLVSQLARKHVTVSLSGDGGDELFYGYDRYLLAYRVWQKLVLVPQPIRQVIAAAIRKTPEYAFNLLTAILPTGLGGEVLFDRLQKLGSVLAHSDGQAFYHSLVSHAHDPASMILEAEEPATIFGNPDALRGVTGFRERMMLLDQLTYLPDDILTKVDRASMAVGLEARVPLLDHRLVEFSLRVPMQYKYKNGQTKWLLRQVLYKYVPPEMMDRPKMGFGVPIEHWLRGPLRDWAEALLDEKRLRDEGVFNPHPIRRMWLEHLSGQRRWHYHLWDILMFQAWSEEWT